MHRIANPFSPVRLRVAPPTTVAQALCAFERSRSFAFEAHR
jgi:hypothetical protein